MKTIKLLVAVLFLTAAIGLPGAEVLACDHDEDIEFEDQAQR